MSAPSISIIIPTYCGAVRLPRTLSSLEGTGVSGGFEVLVVDDGSPDETSATARHFAGRLPLTILRHAANQGRAAACNTGIRRAGADILLILDDDMGAGPGLVERHFAAHEADPEIAVIGRIEQEGLDDQDPFHRFLRREESSRRARLLAAPRIEFGDVWTGQFSLRRAAAIGAGLFDDSITTYGLEDIDFGYRLARSGVRFVYLDDAVAHHAAFADTLDRYCRRHAAVGEVAAYLARRHDTPEMRRYLRVEGVKREATTPFLRLMDASAAILRRPWAASLLGGRAARPLLRGGVRLCESARFDRPLSFLYSFLRDLEYFRALHAARRNASS